MNEFKENDFCYHETDKYSFFKVLQVIDKYCLIVKCDNLQNEKGKTPFYVHMAELKTDYIN